jgi:hypothetical protein
LASGNKDDLTREQAQTAIARLLLARVRRDRHPSFTEMNVLEQVLPRSLYRDYLIVLLEKVMRERWPSVSMLRRIQRFAAYL